MWQPSNFFIRTAGELQAAVQSPYLPSSTFFFFFFLPEMQIFAGENMALE